MSCPSPRQGPCAPARGLLRSGRRRERRRPRGRIRRLRRWGRRRCSAHRGAATRRTIASASAGLSRTTAPPLSGDSARARLTASRPGDDDSCSSRASTASAILKASSAAACCEAVPLGLEHAAALVDGGLEGTQGVVLGRGTRSGSCLHLGAGRGEAGCVAGRPAVALDVFAFGEEASSSTRSASGLTTDRTAVSSRMIADRIVTTARRVWRAMTISPLASSSRTARTMVDWAASTMDIRTAPMTSSSSVSSAWPRSDRFRLILSMTSGSSLEPLIAMARSGILIPLSTSWRVLSSMASTSSKVNMRARTASASSGSALLQAGEHLLFG